MVTQIKSSSQTSWYQRVNRYYGIVETICRPFLFHLLLNYGTQILVIAKLRKYFFWEALFMISSVPARNYMFKVSNWSTRIRCENCSRLRMKTLERCQWRRSSIFIINCQLIIVKCEQANVCWVHIEKTNTWREHRAHHALCCRILSVNKLY